MTGLLILDLIIFLAIIAFGIFSSVHERVFAALITLIALGVAIYYQYGIAPSGDNWYLYVLGTFGYFLLGGFYALFVTWPRYLRRNSAAIVMIRDKFANDKAKDPEYTMGADNFMETSTYQRAFSAASNKSRILTYISTWLWDAVWTVFKNPIKWMYNTVYDMFGRGFERVGVSVTNKIVNDAPQSRILPK